MATEGLVVDWLHPTGEAFQVTGRGIAYVYRIDPPQPAGVVRKLKGTELKIGDTLRVVQAVETFAVGDATLLRECSLLVS